MVNKTVIWNGVKISFFIIGTTIGAGFASGREIWEFFTSYGGSSTYFIILSVLLLSISCYIIMDISRRIEAEHYVHVLEMIIGKHLAKVYDGLIILYLLSTSVIMFAGSGATIQYWNLPYWIGVVAMGAFVFIVFTRDVDGIMTLNSILIPVLIATLMIVCLFFVANQYGEEEFEGVSKQILPSAITFSALNILPLVAILSALGSRLKKTEIKIASISTAIGLLGISMLYNKALLLVGVDVFSYEIPLYAMLAHFPQQFIMAISVVLWLAIYTTAVSGVFGIVSRVKQMIPFSSWMIAGMIIIILIPLTKIGFAKLIQILYPFYGMLNLFLLSMILLYPLLTNRE